MPAPTDPTSDEGFMKYIAKTNGMDAQTVESFVMGRAFKKQADKLWEGYQAAPTVEEATSGESESKISEIEAEETSTDNNNNNKDNTGNDDDDSSSLGSLSSDEASSSSSSSSLEESEASKVKVLSEIDQYILRQGWVGSADDLPSFKSARSYAKKYLPLVEEALRSGNINNPTATSTKGNDTVKENNDEPTLLPTPTYGTKKASSGNCILLSSLPSSWYSSTAAATTKSKAAYVAALSKMDESSREGKVLKRKLSELTGEDDAFTRKVAGIVGGSPAGIRPLLVNEFFVGACIVRFDSTEDATICLERLSGEPGKTITEFKSNGVSLIASATYPDDLPEPQPDGKITPFILTQPPDTVRIKKKRVFEKKEHPWWEDTYAKKEPAAAELEKKKEEEKKEAVAKAKTFPEYIMAKMGLDQESLDSYLSSRKFIKVKDQLEKEYQDSVAA